MDPPRSTVEYLSIGYAVHIHQLECEIQQLRQRLAEYEEKEKAAEALPQKNVVAENMQGELIAILNAMYAKGMFGCSKKELMERMGNGMGCPGIADYSRSLNKIKQTYKYEEIFKKLQDIAIQERDKND